MLGSQTGDVQACLAARWVSERDARHRELDRLRACLPTLVDVLVRHFGARKVVVFGSIARGDLSGNLDLDLAVESVPPELHWKAAATLARLAGTDVDLVPLESVPDRIASVIAAEGRILHG